MNFNFNQAIDIINSKLGGWTESLVSMLPNFVVSIMALILFYFIARLARMVSKRIFNKISEKRMINDLLANLIYITINLIGLIIALNELHLQQTVTSILAGAGIIGLALGFAFQDIAANFISGILITVRRPIQVGDIIQTHSFMGKVEKIDLRVTVIRTFQGLHVIIPNKDIFQTPVTNFTKTFDRRIDLQVGVSYGEDLDQVKKVAVEAIQEVPYLLKDREVGFYYTEFADSSINFLLTAWIAYPDEPGYLESRSDVIMRIKRHLIKTDFNSLPNQNFGLWHQRWGKAF